MDKILMIEDETSLREWFEGMLRAMDRGVDWAADADSARTLMMDPTKHYDLVVSDFDLHSKLNGLDLWQLCQKKLPNTPFLLISGVPDHLFHDMIRSGAACPPFLLKPFGAREFQNMLQELLLKKVEQLKRAG